MANYKSKYTGAQIDGAIGDVSALQKAVEALNAISPHEHFTVAKMERVAGTVTNIEYWFFVNAKWDAEAKRFKRIDINKNSFGIQMQAAGTYPGEETLGYIDNQSIGYWRAIGRDYFTSMGDTANAEAVTEEIGVMIGDEWREFGVYLGWNNCFMLDSYGGMTIGGAGFEIDGNGIYPYARVSLSKHEDVAGSDGYTFLGLLWNAYHRLSDSDDKRQCDYAIGLKSPINYMHDGEYNQYSSYADMEKTTFVVMRRPAGAAHDMQTFKPVYEFDMDGNLHIDASIYVEVDATVFDSTSAQILYPDSLNKDNIEIVRAYAVTESGNVEVTITTVNKTQYGVLLGYSADVAVTEMKVVCANAAKKRTINFLSIQDGYTQQYATNGIDNFGSYSYKLTQPVNGVGVAVNTGVKLYDSGKNWTIAGRFKDDISFDDSFGCVFELQKAFPDESTRTAVYLRILKQSDGTIKYNFAGGFGGFDFDFDNCTGYVAPTDGYHTFVIAKNGGNYEFYLDSGLAYGVSLGYDITEAHMTDETLYLFGRVEDGNMLNTVTGIIDDFRIYNAYLNKTVVTNLIADMNS